MKKISILFALFIILLSCTKQERKIEIYLLKSRAENIKGIPLKEYIKNVEWKIDTANFKYVTYDTIEKNFVYAGEFDISKSILEDKPFIEDEEIEYLDLKRNIIVFKKSAGRKIGSLKGKMTEGHQFVITENGIPIFGGYFWSIFSSYKNNWNTILHVHQIKSHEPKEDSEYPIFIENGMNEPDSKIDFKKHPKLIEALKKSNKIRE
ncbi:MAG TPA: hypothetical protein PLL09_14065 [Flavobacterium sp.]|uniref:hypothetical protein n=1 Tax=unclassified Flavobacterium TaxID=196869 RepID=UPI0025C62895|nr:MULTISPECIES: hypothetical protein [unclassified Flavobacterium]HRE78939.1 hypothetical protein [Flavobacterium sp.]